MQMILARRGLGRLIEGLMRGEPVAWTLVGAVLLGVVLWAIFSPDEEESASSGKTGEEKANDEDAS